MFVEAKIGVSITTEDVDRHGSIAAAVADNLGVDEYDLLDIGTWTWIYDSNEEYDWATKVSFEPLTGDPWDEDDEVLED